MNIVVGVTGGIAAYKTVQLVRLLVKSGHEVHVVPTVDALRFVGQPTWEAVSRHPVTTSVHEDVASVRHVALGQAADLVVVAPATANTLARMAAGLADDLLGTTLLATSAPVLVAPAMHTEMWLHPATQANMETLRGRGVLVIGPETGRLTGDDSGPGRMSEPETIHAEIARILTGTRRAADPRRSSGRRDAAGQHCSSSRRDAAGLHCSDGRRDAAGLHCSGDRRDAAGLRILVSAGGTREPIDPVRYLGNRSSGRQGVEVARAAAARGAAVALVVAHVEDAILAEAAHAGIEIRRVGTAAELGAAMDELAPSADVVVMAAAVADYRAAEVAERKLTKEAAAGAPPSLELVENADILAGLAAHRTPGQTIVGFAAEMPEEGETLLERGTRKRHRKGVDLLAVNAVGWSKGFERADNALLILAAPEHAASDPGEVDPAASDPAAPDRAAPDSAAPDRSGVDPAAPDRIVAEVSGTKRETAEALIDAILRLRRS